MPAHRDADVAAGTPPLARVLASTALAMVAFAANSLLCRVALRDTGIDAVSFTTVRLFSGAVVLALLVWWRAGRSGVPAPTAPPRAPATRCAGSWTAAAALAAYAFCFSLAYVRLSAATGALLLFGAVQATMIGRGWWLGERSNAMQLAGYALAAAGIVGMLLPGLSAPPLGAAALMVAAGAAWGVYSLLGKGARDPLRVNASNFLRACFFALPVWLLALPMARHDAAGVLYATLSGAVASGLGYAVWYAALRGLSLLSAGLVQLSVPMLAAAGGVILLGEPVTWRLALASAAVLGGIALGMAAAGRGRRRPSGPPGG